MDTSTKNDGHNLHIGILDADSANSETLQLSTRQESDITVVQVLQLQSAQDFVKIVEGSTALKKKLDALLGSTNGLGDLVHILRLDNSLQVILKELGEIV